MTVSYSFAPGYTFATPRTIPYDFAEVSTPFATDSATYVDIPGATVAITITDTVAVEGKATIAWSAASTVVASFRFVIDASEDAGESSDALPGNRDIVVPLLYALEGLAPGAHAAKLQVKKTAGAGDVTISHVDLSLTGMQAQ